MITAPGRKKCAISTMAGRLSTRGTPPLWIDPNHSGHFRVPAASLPLFSCLSWLIPGCSNDRGERELFLQGRELVVTGRYDEAVSVLETYVSAYPQGKYSSRAYLFWGKALLGQWKLDDAARVFDDGARLFPETLEGHKCRYKRGVVDLLRGDPASARARFATLADHPDGPLAPEARAFRQYLAE